MSRTVGPYKDVATARVEGAYELCEGADENGRPVQILTLGATSSKDPARRGLLSDTVAWAYATAGPEDAPILVADLEAEQPYVVVLRDPRLRGADRIMDRLLALGPATGPLPVGPAAAAQRAAHQQQLATAAPSSPTGPPSPPPVSPPVVVIAPPKKRSQLKPILIGIGSVIVIVALVVGGWIIFNSAGPGGDADGSLPAADVSDNAAAGEVSQGPEGAAEEAPDDDAIPQWNESAHGMSVAGSEFGADDDTRIQAYRDWPFAFKVPAEYVCERQGDRAVCTTDEAGSTLTVGWEVCERGCPDDEREMLRKALPYQPMQELGNAGEIGFSQRTEVYGYWRGSMSVFVATGDEVVHATAVADVLADRGEEAKRVFNDVLNQVSARGTAG